MKPDVPVVMNQFFGKMLLELGPALEGTYASGSSSVMGLMMFMAGEEYERGAQVRVEDIAELRDIFGEASGLVSDAALKQKLGEAAQGSETSLRISELDSAHGQLAKTLIELQGFLESTPGDWAAALEERIYAHLLRSAEARRMPYPDMG